MSMQISKLSHLDHGLTSAHTRFLLERFGDVEAFHMETIEMPEELSSLECALWGPIMGDHPIVESEVVYRVRGERDGASRMRRCADSCRTRRDECCTPRETRKLTVIMGPSSDGKGCVLYTAYGGPAAPREPFDPSIAYDLDSLSRSKEFWSKHALVQSV